MKTSTVFARQNQNTYQSFLDNLLPVLCLLFFLAEANAQDLGKVTITTDQAPIQLGEKVIARANKGEEMIVTKINEEWYCVMPSRGWISGKFVQFHGSPAVKQPSEKVAALSCPNEMSVDLGNGVVMELVFIKPGAFLMGSEKCVPDAKPVHQVTITKPFYMGKYEVTQEQWQAVMGGNPSKFKGPKLPVEYISWDDCQSYLARMQEKTGRKFILPTEAEWEYACRAGSTNAYCFGDDAKELGDYAWYESNSTKTPHPVGTKKSNAWGLYDMHGNVWEWCEDWRGDYPTGAVTDPKGPRSGVQHVLRSGSWRNNISRCQASERGGNVPSCLHESHGLRVVMVPKQ